MLLTSDAGNYKEELTMRDIRADLQERLDAIGRDREELKRRIADLEPIETAIKAVLQRESENFAVSLPPDSERKFDSFGAIDAVSSFNTKETGNGFGGKEPMVNYAPMDAVSGVKLRNWGEFKIG